MLRGAEGRLTARAPAGCLIYYTSHGGPPGVVLDVSDRAYVFTPEHMAKLVNAACPGRPTIVVISACFSGVFVPALAERATGWC